MTRVVRENTPSTTIPKWRTGNKSTGADAVGEIPGAVISVSLPSPDYTGYTFAISGVGTLPGSLKIMRPATKFILLDAVNKQSFGPANTTLTLIPTVFEFGDLGTYVADITLGATHKATSTTDTDTGRYTFHVGPMAELELKAVWAAPGVFTLTALNHGPDDPPASQVEVTLPPSLRFVRSEASQGSYDPITGVWDIGKLEHPGYWQALGLPEGATLTIYTEPAANTGTPNQMITASIGNHRDYCVRIKTGATSPANDLDCVGVLPSGYTEHSAAYYDYRPKNNRISLPSDWTATQSVASTRLTGVAFTSQGSYQPGTTSKSRPPSTRR